MSQYSIELPINVPSFVNMEQATFEEIEDMLRKALSAEAVTTTIAQACFSFILLERRWLEARAWMDSKTKELYYSPDKAPDGVTLVESQIRRFQNTEEWVQSLENTRGFARSTCYQRHAEIVRQMELLGRSFEEAVKSVVLSTSYSRLVMDRMVDNNDRFIPEEVVKLLPPLMRDSALQKIYDGDIVLECRKIIIEQLEADEIRLEEGTHPRQTIADVKKRLGTYAEYTLNLSESGRSFIIRQDKNDIITQYHVLIECENPLEKPPLEVVHWLAARMHVKLK